MKWFLAWLLIIVTRNQKPESCRKEVYMLFRRMTPSTGLNPTPPCQVIERKSSSKNVNSGTKVQVLMG